MDRIAGDHPCPDIPESSGEQGGQSAEQGGTDVAREDEEEQPGKTDGNKPEIFGSHSHAHKDSGKHGKAVLRGFVVAVHCQSKGQQRGPAEQGHAVINVGEAESLRDGP